MKLTKKQMERNILIYKKQKVNFDNLTYEEADLEHQKICFPHRFEVSVKDCPECDSCVYREVIFGNVVCLKSVSTTCPQNNFIDRRMKNETII